MIDLNAWQQDFTAWVRHNFPDETRPLAALAVAEESGELCRAILKQAQGIRGTREEWEREIATEIADVFMAVTWVAILSGLDMETLLAERWKEIGSRDWVANPNGHGLPQ